MKTKRILILEDKEDERRSLELDFANDFVDKRVGALHFDVRSKGRESDCKEIYGKELFHLLIVDLRLPPGDGNGKNFLRWVRERDQITPIMVLSGEANAKDFREIGKYSNTYYYDKTQASKAAISRFDQSISCLVDGENCFRRLHQDFFVPPEVCERLYESKFYDSQVLYANRRSILAYYRDPERGLKGKGFLGLLDAVCETIEEYLVEISSELFSSNEQLHFAAVRNVLMGVHSLRNMEQFLKLDPNYREHFVHQFQNFMLGCVIYDCFRPGLKKHLSALFSQASGMPIKDPLLVEKLFEVAWFFTAMFHDFAYPVQAHDDLVLRYFEDNFCYRFPPTKMDAENCLLREGVEMDIQAIGDDFWKGQAQREVFRLLLVHEFVNKNHAIHSAVALRKLLKYHSNGDGFCKLLAPVFSAIALHDWGLWSKARRVRERQETDGSQSKRYKYNLDFATQASTNPLLYLLLIVDNVQGWGRPRGGRPFYSSSYLELLGFEIDKNVRPERLTIALSVREGLRSRTSKRAFDDQVRVFRNVAAILSEDTVPVTITLYQGYDKSSQKIISLDQTTA